MGAPAPSPAGESWLEKWSEWEIQAVVAVSFGLQVVLFFFAGIHRYSVSSVLKILLWLVYLLADTVAIYGLGHMSASLSKTPSDKHHLVALWVPFLLLHLGGQDTITAYALEDNKLWLRHLLNMFVQVAGTGYVLYKYIIADRATIISAAVLVSGAGFVKYGERIWALKSASKGSNGPDRLDIYGEKEINWFTRKEKFGTYGLTVMTAHALQYVFVKPLIIDRVSTNWSRGIEGVLSIYVEKWLNFEEGDVLALEKRYAKEVYRAVEVQLALVYDMLYTKAQVIHTWYGYLIRGISFVSCSAALVAFTRSNTDSYCTPDIVITFVLLGGACTLEVASAFKVIGSTWTYAILRWHRRDWLAKAILFARYHLIVVKDGRWSNSVGQYDFISFCASDKTKLKRRMAGWIGLKDWWNKAHYTKHAKISPALKEFVWGLLRGQNSDMVQIEDVATRRGYWACKLTGFNQSDQLDWSLRLEFHYCVYIWHIATSTFLSHPTVKSGLVDMGMAEAVNTLSEYTIYLLVQHPDILPINEAARSLFEETYASFLEEWNWNSKKHTENGILDVPHQIILDYTQECPKFTRKLFGGLTDADWADWDAYPGEAVLAKASTLVWTMLEMELGLTHKLVIIGTVWKEMLCYAATNASGDFHARQLSNGGEFLTHVLLLTTFCKIVPQPVAPSYRAAADDQPVEVAAHVELNVYNDHEEEITEVSDR